MSVFYKPYADDRLFPQSRVYQNFAFVPMSHQLSLVLRERFDTIAVDLSDSQDADGFPLILCDDEPFYLPTNEMVRIYTDPTRTLYTLPCADRLRHIPPDEWVSALTAAQQFVVEYTLNLWQKLVTAYPDLSLSHELNSDAIYSHRFLKLTATDAIIVRFQNKNSTQYERYALSWDYNVLWFTYTANTAAPDRRPFSAWGDEVNGFQFSCKYFAIELLRRLLLRTLYYQIARESLPVFLDLQRAWFELPAHYTRFQAQSENEC